ncbi:hypothetical protein ACFQU7_36840 [Pseudoroseomonas wenyumeiae]
MYGIQHSKRGEVILIGGGLHVVRNGTVIGAVDASAGTVAQELVIAEPALVVVAPPSSRSFLLIP